MIHAGASFEDVRNGRLARHVVGLSQDPASSEEDLVGIVGDVLHAVAGEGDAGLAALGALGEVEGALGNGLEGGRGRGGGGRGRVADVLARLPSLLHQLGMENGF